MTPTFDQFNKEKMEEFRELPINLGSFLEISSDRPTSAETLTNFLSSSLRQAYELGVKSVELEKKTNLITKKKRLTYSDVDDAYAQAISDLESLKEKLLKEKI